MAGAEARGDQVLAVRPARGRPAALAGARSEDPLAIIAEVEAGLRGAGLKRGQGPGTYLVEPDRRAAIGMALYSTRAILHGRGGEVWEMAKENFL